MFGNFVQCLLQGVADPAAHIMANGDKGGSAPSVDPNIGIAQKQMADLANKEYSDWQTQIWPTLQAQSNQQQALATQTANADLATQQQQQQIAGMEQAQVQKNLYPVQDQITQQALNYNTAGNIEQQSALAMGDVRNAFDLSRKAQSTQMQSYGIDPTSGQFQGMQNASQVQQAAASAAAGTQARNNAVQLGWSKMLDAANVNAGLPSQQTNNAAAAVGAGTSAVNTGQVPIQNSLAQGSAMGSQASIPINAYGAIGGLGTQTYNSQINAWNAQQQANATSSAGWGSALGTVAGAFIGGPAGAAVGGALGNYLGSSSNANANAYTNMSMQGSDLRVKENLRRVGETDSGVPIYAFTYKHEFQSKWGPGLHIGVLAQDMARVDPSAVSTGDDGYLVVDYTKVK